MPTSSEPQVHVIPAGDLVAHDVSEACVCGPALDPIRRGDGSIGGVIVHHALDGRR